jgi:membrane fusion protein (multidrug efflux system)
MRRFLISVLLLLIVGAGVYYAIYGSPLAQNGSAGGASGGKGQRNAGASDAGASDAGGQRQGRRGAPVEVGVARQGVATDDLWSVGSLRSDESVQISAEVAGRISEILFKEGEEVKAGDVLIKLDDALAKAEVEEVKSRQTLAQSNFDRAQSLSRSGSGTERALDEATSALQTARAELQLAETRLAKLSITAPFDGRVGLRTLSVGAYATPGAPIVNLEKIDQLKLDFRVPEIVLTQVSTGQEVEATVDAQPGRKFNGKIYAIDPQVDVNGRSLRIRARIDNADLALRPGLFARVIIKGLEERQVVRVPESAVVPRGEDNLVYSIVGGKAKENKVSLGRRRAGEVEILQGIDPGTQVVVAGQMNLKDGSAVEVVAGPTQSAQQE